MGPVTWKISEYSSRPGYRPSDAGRKRYVHIGPVNVWILTDSVSLIIIPFSDVDGIKLDIASQMEVMALTRRGHKKTIPDTISFLLAIDPVRLATK